MGFLYFVKKEDAAVKPGQDLAESPQAPRLVSDEIFNRIVRAKFGHIEALGLLVAIEALGQDAGQFSFSNSRRADKEK